MKSNKGEKLSPLISVIIPVFNGQEYLDEAITSVLTQTYSNIEVVIVDDCSTDRTAEIIEKWARKDCRIKAFKNPRNLNLPNSLNIGHNLGHGEYFTWISHDNIMESNCLQTLYNTLKSSGCDIAYSNFQYIDEQSKTTGTHHLTNFNELIFGNVIGPSFLYSKEVCSRTPYDPFLFGIEDYDFWLRASRLFKFKHTPELLYYYRKHDKSLSNQIKTNNKALKRQKILKYKTIRKFFNECGLLNHCHLKLIYYLGEYSQKHLQDFIKRHKTFSEIFIQLELATSTYNHKDLMRSYYMRMRTMLFKSVSDQNINTLFKLIKFCPKIFINFSKKKSLRLILKLIKF